MDLNFKKENFSIQTMNISEDGDGWSGLLREVFISDATMAQNYRTLVGHIRIPEIQNGDNKPRCKMVNIEDPRCIVQRLVYLQTFSNYLKAHNLKGTDFKYVIITYTGAIESEWFAYANLLMKFVDYILPYLVKNINGITVDNLVFTEHAKPNVGNTTFHILFTAQEATEFQQLWTMYIDFTERRKLKPETEEKKESDSNNKDESKTSDSNQENKVKNEESSSDNSQSSQADDNTSEKNSSDGQVQEMDESNQLPPGVKIDNQTGEVIEENSQDENKSNEQIDEDDIPDPNDLDDDENFNPDEDEEDIDDESDDDSEQDTNLQAISFNDSDDEYAETEDEEGGD